MVAPDQRPPRFVLPDWLPLPSFASLVTFIALIVIPVVAVVALYPSMHVTLVPQTTTLERVVDVTVDPDCGERTRYPEFD